MKVVFSVQRGIVANGVVTCGHQCHNRLGKRILKP